jgi:hypothetical protein
MSSLANSYKEELPYITGWNSNKDLDQLAARYKEKNPNAAAETGTGAYWQQQAGIKSVDSENDFNQIYDKMRSASSTSEPAPNPAANADIPQARARAEAANTQLNESRPMYQSGMSGLKDSDIKAAADFGNRINGPNGFTAKFMDWQKKENTASIGENNRVSQDRANEYMNSNPKVATGVDTAGLMKQYIGQLKQFA